MCPYSVSRRIAGGDRNHPVCLRRPRTAHGCTSRAAYGRPAATAAHGCARGRTASEPPPAAPATRRRWGILPTKDEPRWLQDQAVFQKAGYDAASSARAIRAKEKANVEALISQGIKVLIICPQDGTAAAAAAEEAQAAGVKVISYDRLILRHGCGGLLRDLRQHRGGRSRRRST